MPDPGVSSATSTSLASLSSHFDAVTAAAKVAELGNDLFRISTDRVVISNNAAVASLASLSSHYTAVAAAANAAQSSTVLLEDAMGEIVSSTPAALVSLADLATNFAAVATAAAASAQAIVAARIAASAPSPTEAGDVSGSGGSSPSWWEAKKWGPAGTTASGDSTGARNTSESGGSILDQIAAATYNIAGDLTTSYLLIASKGRKPATAIAAGEAVKQGGPQLGEWMDAGLRKVRDLFFGKSRDSTYSIRPQIQPWQVSGLYGPMGLGGIVNAFGNDVSWDMGLDLSLDVYLDGENVYSRFIDRDDLTQAHSRIRAEVPPYRRK